MLDYPHRALPDLQIRWQNFEFLGREELVVARGQTTENRVRRSLDVPHPGYPSAKMRRERRFATILVFENLLGDRSASCFGHEQGCAGVSYVFSVDVDELVD